MVFTRLDAYKMSALELAEHHKKHCDGESCGVSLIMLREMCEKLGIEFTKEEANSFV